MYNKNNFEVAKVASKSPIKLELSTVALYGNRSVATDSWRLIEMSATGEAHEPRLYPGAMIKAVKLGKNESLAESEIPVKELEGYTYPDVDQVIKSHFDRVDDPDSYSSITLNAELLEQVLGVLKKLSKFKAVTLSVPTGPGRPVLVQAESKEKGYEQKARALVMPHNK